jgi:DNA mismatch repair protein MutL
LPARSLTERAYQVFGEVVLHEIHAEREGVVLDALLAPIEHARAGARQLYLFVNGRPINDRGLARAVAFAFGDRLPPGQYPRGLVSLRLAPDDVDVNAHPQKTEVRFRNSAQLVDRVTRMIAARLPAHPPGDAYWEARIGTYGALEDRPKGASDSPPPSPSTLAEPIGSFRPRYSNGLGLVAQLRDRVLICESSEELLVLDRAGAETEVRYDALRHASEAGALARWNLLFPDRLELERSEQLSLERNEATLRRLGFDWSALGERSCVLRAIPALLAEARPPALFKRAIATLGSSGEPSLEAVLLALAETAATPNGESLEERGAQGIVSKVRLSDDRHRACVLARVALPVSVPGIADD